MSAVFINGKIGILSPYRLRLISLIQCAKKLLSAITVASRLVALFVPFLIFIGKTKCTL